MPQEDNFNQEVLRIRQNLEYNVKDDDLVLAIDKAMFESKDLKEEMDRIGKINKLYWKVGTAKDLSRIHPKKARVTSNRIFTDVETAIPILTSETPEPTIIGDVDNATQERIQKGLQIAYEVKYKLQSKLQCLIRHWFLFRLGVLKYRWDKDKGFITENVLTRKIGFDKRATSKENCEYVWEEMEDKLENLWTKFPKAKQELQRLYGKDNPKAKAKYIEFWGGNGEWVCWKLKQTILDKKKNPNWDYEDETNNLFELQQFPYLFLSVFAFGDETGLYDETSLVEETAPLQEGVNKLEQQIIDLNEGQKRVWVGSGEAISAQKFQELLNATGDFGVYYDRKAPAGALSQVQSGKPDASLFNNLSHLLNEIDNTIGIHSTTRGERAQQETLGGRQLLMGSDYGRLDLIVRNVEQIMEEWFNAYLHMLKVYSIETEVLRNGKEAVELTKEDIPQGLIVMIKKGSTLPTDEKSKVEHDIALANAGLLAPRRMFEDMKDPDPEKSFQELIEWLVMTGKVNPQALQGQTQQAPPPQQNQQPIQEGQQGNQLDRLNGILKSPQFQSLPPEEQKQIVIRGRQIVESIKQQQ